MTTNTAIQNLVDRMLSYDGRFDGYPQPSDSDVFLVQEAVRTRRLQGMHETTDIPFVCYLASEYVKTKEQYDKAYQFILDYVQNCWYCNMAEGSNPVFEQINEEGENNEQEA